MHSHAGMATCASAARLRAGWGGVAELRRQPLLRRRARPGQRGVGLGRDAELRALQPRIDAYGAGSRPACGGGGTPGAVHG